MIRDNQLAPAALELLAAHHLQFKDTHGLQKPEIKAKALADNTLRTPITCLFVMKKKGGCRNYSQGEHHPTDTETGESQGGPQQAPQIKATSKHETIAKVLV